MQIHNSTDIIADIKQIIEHARKQAYASINTLMIQSNWLVGRRIVEEEQGGAARAEYGKALLKNLATELMPIYGNSYSVRRLQDYRQFYLYFKDIEIWHSECQILLGHIIVNCLRSAMRQLAIGICRKLPKK